MFANACATAPVSSCPAVTWQLRTSLCFPLKRQGHGMAVCAVRGWVFAADTGAHVIAVFNLRMAAS